MQKVYLLEPYEGKGANDIIIVSNNIAHGLIEQGIARLTKNRDFLVKPQMGKTKAFRKSPSGRRR